MKFLNSADLMRFERQYSWKGRDGSTNTAEVDGHPICQYAVIEDGRNLSINPLLPVSPNLVALVPRLLAWGDADSFLDLIHSLDYQAARIRLHQALDDIERVDSEISRVLRDLLEKLPAWAAVRFTIAPATRSRVALLHQDPAAHVAFLYRSLKAELRLSGETVSGEGCWTALGDFFLTDKAARDFVDPRLGDWNPDMNLRAPRLHQVVPVDGLSPNVRDLSSANRPYSPHQSGEFAAVEKNLEDAMEFTRSAASNAGKTIERFVKVIVVLKANVGSEGSSSHYTFPGQIVVRNSHVAPEFTIVSALVHEAIHQILYVLESGKRFVDPKASLNRMTVESAWTQRQLPIHSYLHACFVWFGLATFWRRALHSTLLPADSMQTQLDEALRGFRVGNPADRLLPFRDLIDPEAMQSVASLWDELRRAGELNSRLVAFRDSPPTGATGAAPAANVLH